MCECCGVAGVASTEGGFSVAPREGLGLKLLSVVLFKKRLSNLSVVAGSDAGQSTELLMYSCCWYNLVEKMVAAKKTRVTSLWGLGMW